MPIGKPRKAADMTNLLPGGASVATLVPVGKPVTVAAPAVVVPAAAAAPKTVKLAAKTSP